MLKGDNHFIAHRRTTRALLKFCDDHGNTLAAVRDIRACLAALDAGNRSNAIASFKRIPMGKEGFGDWWPPAVGGETDEYSWAVFEALAERWHRLMSSLEKHV